MKARSWTIPVIIIFILLISLFYCDKLILGPYATIRIHDNFDSELSRYGTLGKLLLKNGFFAWYPNIDCGMPAYAYHFPPYHMFCLISLLLPAWLLNTAFIIFYMFIAAFGMYWLLKDFLGVTAKMSFLGGLLFSLFMQLFGHSVVCVIFNYAFPMFFMCLITTGRKRASFSARLFSLIFVILVLSFSYPVLTIPFFCILQFLLIIFLTYDTGLSAKKMLFNSILIWTGYVLLFAPVLYSLYAFIPFSHRTHSHHYAGISEFLVSLPKDLIQAFLRYASEPFLLLLVIGLVPLIFYSRKVRRIFFILISLVLMATFFKKMPTIIRGTLFEKMDLSHFSMVTAFPVILFVIAGMDEFFRRKIPKILYVFSFLTAGWTLIYFMRTPEMMRMTSSYILNFIVPFFAILFCLLFRPDIRHKRIILSAGIVLFIIMFGGFKLCRIVYHEQLTYKQLYESHSVLNNLRKEAEKEPFRVVTTSSFPMVMQSYDLETVEARTVLMPKTYKEFFKEIVRPRLKTKKQSDYFDSYWYEMYLIDGEKTSQSKHEESVEGLFNLPLLLMINTKYIISLYRDPYLESISEKIIEAPSDNLTKANLLKDNFKIAETYFNKPFFKKLIPDKIKDKLAHMQGDTLFKKFYGQPYFVYQLKNYCTRGYLASNALVFDSDNEVLSELSAQPIESLKNNAFFLKKDVAIEKIFYERRTLSKGDRIDLIRYSPDKLIFKGMIASPRILVITNNYHPNWRAIVNGKGQKIFRVNHTFQAVFLEKAGSFTVTLLYEDPLLWKTHWLVLFGVILIIYAAFRRIESDKEKIGAV